MLGQLAGMPAPQPRRVIVTDNRRETALRAALRGRVYPFELVLVENQAQAGFGANAERQGFEPGGGGVGQHAAHGGQRKAARAAVGRSLSSPKTAMAPSPMNLSTTPPVAATALPTMPK